MLLIRVALILDIFAASFEISGYAGSNEVRPREKKGRAESLLKKRLMEVVKNKTRATRVYDKSCGEKACRNIR